jgi:peptide/nickel transport system substrate-binding protein
MRPMHDDRESAMRDQDAKTLIDHLAAGARRGTVSRRTFMEGALFTGATVAGASTLWSTKVLAQTPSRGGNYRVGVHDANTGDTMDPGLYQAVYEIQLAHCHRGYLTEITADGSAGPDVADSWSASPDATEWRFELNPDATFHSGKKLTSEDVIASLNHHRGDDTNSAAKALLNDVTDIKADGDHAVVITLASGSADLPYLLTDYHLVICPANPDGSIDWQSMDGTGPYKIVQHEPGVGTALVRHDAYHREGLAWFDEVTMVALADPNARQSAILTGEVDAITEADLKTVGLMGRNPNIKIVEVASGAHSTIPMFCDVEPFNDVNVRLALKYAINRQEIVDKILFGHGSLGNDNPIGPSLPYYADLPQREYDPDKAKFHLKEAGYDTLAVSLSASQAAFSGAVDMAVLFQESAKAAGIDINVVREPNDGYWSDVWLNKPFVVVQWGARPTPDVMFSLAYREGADWNESHWVNDRFNALLLEAKAELDDAKRAEMYAEMQMLVRDDGGTIVPFFRNRVNVMSTKLGAPEQQAGNWELDGARSYQRWWFNS